MPQASNTLSTSGSHAAGVALPVPGDPTVSFVAVSRNDNHGGDMTARMEMFIHALAQQCDSHHLNAELILVDWNPPANRSPLKDALRWPPSGGRLAIRVIEVSRELHAQFRQGERLPLYQMIGKNVGIRRARAPWILCTNVDILFSHALIEWMAAESMEYGKNYHVDRYDVDMPVPDADDIKAGDLLAACDRHLLRWNRRDGSMPLNDEQAKAAFKPWVFTKRTHLHTNACGDFALAHRDHWYATRGYGEQDLFSFHLDSLWSYTAHYSGFREEVLPPPLTVYHLEHTGGFVPGQTKSMDEGLVKRKVPRLSELQLTTMTSRMSLTRRPPRVNDEGWGLDGQNLPETTVTRSQWSPSAAPSVHIDHSRHRPRLSLIVTGRNDDHGENFLSRTQTFLDGWRDVAELEGIRSEIVFVEWNPPSDRPPLRDALRWDPSSNTDLRYVVVPPELHRRVPNADRIPLFQMIAKNVGARRSRGEWLLFTNIDVLFNRPLVRFLHHAELDPNTLYRTSRFDCGEKVLPDDLAYEERIRYCEQHVVRVNANGKTVPLDARTRLQPTPSIDQFADDHRWMSAIQEAGRDRPLFTNACGDFTLLHRHAFASIRGYAEVPIWSIYVDGLLLHAAMGAGMSQVELGDPLRMFHIEHGRSWVVSTDYQHDDLRLDHKTQYKPWCRQLASGDAPHVNPSDWGFAHIPLPEFSAGTRSVSGTVPSQTMEVS